MMAAGPQQRFPMRARAVLPADTIIFLLVKKDLT